MNEADARAVLLVRALESTPTPAWTAADSAWASAEALRAEGESAAFDRLVARRAILATARLAQREPRLAALPAAASAHAWLGWVVILGALVIGFASDAIGPSGRINILAPPLLALLVWNLAVYVVLVLRSAGALRAPAATGRLRRVLLRMESGLRQAGSGATAAVSRYLSDWAAASGALYGARIAVLLHAGAAALVAGALLSLYLRGLAFEFRAGWDSTFLDAPGVQRLLAFVLGPASWLSGIALPDVEQVAGLRFSGGAGENATRWIHLYAITMGIVVVAPRAILAAMAAWRLRRLTQQFPLNLDDDYYRRLRHSLSREPVEALVLPYSYRLREDVAAGLRPALERIVGHNLRLVVSEPLPQGAEDDLQAWLGGWAAAADASGGQAAALLVALFPLTATPERETHGAFARALAVRRPALQFVALVDESAFRRRFTGAEGAHRLAQRRSAWERVLRDVDVEPVFVDLNTTLDNAGTAQAGVSSRAQALSGAAARSAGS